MDWLTNLKKFKEYSGETYGSISEKTGISKSTLEKLFSGRTADPGLNMSKKISECMGYTLTQLVGEESILTGEDKEMLNKYLLLDDTGRDIVKFVVNHEYERLNEKNAEEFKAMFKTIYYDFPVSAGTGEYMGVDNAKMIETEEEPPGRTTFVLRIAGDSMEPEFSDHDLIYVEQCDFVEYGEIGIFICAGNVYMKQYTKKGLRSLNPKYPIITPDGDMKCFGRVLGTVKGRVNIIG